MNCQIHKEDQVVTAVQENPDKQVDLCENHDSLILTFCQKEQKGIKFVFGY